MKLIIVITLLLSLTSCANSSQYPEEVMFDMASILKDVAKLLTVSSSLETQQD